MSHRQASSGDMSQLPESSGDMNGQSAARPKLTVVVMTQNAAHLIADCLASAAFADEMLVLDSGSTDGTIELAQQLGARVVVDPLWRGFGPQRQHAQTLVSHDWIFWLDSDERITPALRASIEQTVASSAPTQAWQVNRLTDFFGRYIRHSGWYPDWVVRLHHRHHYRYNDAPVHEAIEVPRQQLSSLCGELLHHTSERLDEYLNKSTRYAITWGEARAAKGKRVTVAGVALRPLWTFLRKYLLQRGFLDGGHGLLLAIQSSHYTFTKYFALWVAQQRRQR